MTVNSLFFLIACQTIYNFCLMNELVNIIKILREQKKEE